VVSPWHHYPWNLDNNICQKRRLITH